MSSALLGSAAIFVAGHLFCIKTGLTIDPKKRTYKKYKQLYGVEMGTWYNLKKIACAELVLSIESPRRTLPIALPFLNPGAFYGSSKFKTYNIVLHPEKEFQYTLYKFSSYKDARKCLKNLNETFNFPIEDLVTQKIKENRNNRLRNRR